MIFLCFEELSCISLSELNMDEKESRHLLAVNHFLQLQISKDKELQEIATFAAEICGTQFAMITLLKQDMQYIKYSTGVSVKEILHKDTFCQYTIAQPGVLEVNNAADDARFKNNPYVTGYPKVRFYAGAALTTSDQFNIGTICVFDSISIKLDHVQIRMLESLSKQVINLLEFDSSLQLLKDQFKVSKDAGIKMRAFFESSSSCHLLLDTELRVISFNKAQANIMFQNHQLSLAEGMNISEYVNKEFFTEFMLNYHAALAGASSLSERNLQYKDGRICWYITFDPACNANGDIIGVSINATDITKSVENEEQVLQQTESLERIAHIQSNDLLQSITTITDVMNTIHEQGIVHEVIELQMLADTVKELEEKSIMIS